MVDSEGRSAADVAMEVRATRMLLALCCCSRAAAVDLLPLLTTPTPSPPFRSAVSVPLSRDRPAAERAARADRAAADGAAGRRGRGDGAAGEQQYIRAFLKQSLLFILMSIVAAGGDAGGRWLAAQQGHAAGARSRHCAAPPRRSLPRPAATATATAVGETVEVGEVGGCCSPARWRSARLRWYIRIPAVDSLSNPCRSS